MSEFNNKNNPFSYLNYGQQFSPDYLNNIKEMVNNFNSVLNDDFWNDVNQFTGMNQKRQKKDLVPIEIWENETYYYVNLLVPGLVDASDTSVHFFSDQRIGIKARVSANQPVGAKALVLSEFPQTFFKKEINLPQPVNGERYTKNLENNILLLTLEKKEDNSIELPFNF